jgi:hypothetical protein
VREYEYEETRVVHKTRVYIIYRNENDSLSETLIHQVNLLEWNM